MMLKFQTKSSNNQDLRQRNSSNSRRSFVPGGKTQAQTGEQIGGLASIRISKGISGAEHSRSLR
jgi:hypothetical protein